MILDTSAIVAVIQEEPGFRSLLNKVRVARFRAVSAPILVESAFVLTRTLEADTEKELSFFLRSLKIDTVPFVDDHWREAAQAFRRFGKGRHPAKLNLGDCMSYATAKVAGLPLLCLGDDFSKTDLELA